ncbi:MAG: DUF559 domain-containing protein, partial [Marmoricola sp.]
IYEPILGRVRYRLDVPCPEVRYAAEYDGVQHHTSEEDRRHDADRRRILADEYGWSIDAFTSADVYALQTDIVDRLRAGFDRARRSVSRWTP